MTGSLRFRLPALFLLGIVLVRHRRGADRAAALPVVHARAVVRGAPARGLRARAAVRAVRTSIRRHGSEGAELRRGQARAGDRGQDLLRRCACLPGRALRSAKAARVGRAAGCRVDREDADVRVRAAGPVPHVSRRSRAAAPATQRRPLRRARRRQAEDRAPAAVAAARRAPCSGVPLRCSRRGNPLLVPLAPHHRTRAGAVRRDRPDRRGPLRRPRSRREEGARSATWPSASTRWPCGSPSRRSASGTS